MQLVLMSLKPGEEIGDEVHDDRDQFFRVEAGEAEFLIDGARHRVRADFAVIVPAGARHNVRSVGDEPLKLYTIYGPPEHRRDVVQRTKPGPEAAEEHFDGKTTE
jgi:mannose-6-phosphate isomerase-like protein (cupin superfamily)